MSENPGKRYLYETLLLLLWLYNLTTKLNQKHFYFVQSAKLATYIGM